MSEDRSEAEQLRALEEKRIAEDRKHSLKVAKVSIIPALITALATIAAAFITVLWKADTVGAKVNAQQGTPGGVISNVTAGVKTFANLTNPDQPLSAALPNCNPTQTVTPTIIPAQRKTPIAPEVPAATPDSEKISTDPSVLKSCYGLGSLKLERIRVEPVASGYEISMRLHNPTPSPESLMVTGPIKLSDSKDSLDGRANIGGGPFYAGGATDQKQLAGLFSTGDMISADDATSLNIEFSARGQFLPAKFVTFGATLLHYTKAEDGTFSRQNTSMTCQDIPVLPSSR